MTRTVFTVEYFDDEQRTRIIRVALPADADDIRRRTLAAMWIADREHHSKNPKIKTIEKG